jgi:hypothetical protein
MERSREMFLIEQYRPGLRADELEQIANRVRLVVDRFERSGTPIRFVRSTIVPADEAILSLVEAVSEAIVREAYARAGSPIERISAAIDQGGRP